MTASNESPRVHVHPVEWLIEDHALILDKLRKAEDRIDAESAGERAFEPDYWNRLAEFLHIFADIEHHAREEQILFVAMQKEGVITEGGPIGFMLAEHQEGRALISRIQESAREGREEECRRAAATYVELARQHIWKENEIIFKLAVKVLPEEACEDIFGQFERLEIDHRNHHPEVWLDDLLRSI